MAGASSRRTSDEAASAHGEVAGEVGGGLWIPFLIAVVVAALSAPSYAELVGISRHHLGAVRPDRGMTAVLSGWPESSGWQDRG